MSKLGYYEPDYSAGNWPGGAAATLELMQQGVTYIHHGVLLTTYRDQYTLLTHIPHPKLSQIKKAIKVVHNN